MTSSPSSSGRVLVVGSINVDLVVAVGRLPAPGETVLGDRLERHGGGKSANQAVAAARLGGSVELAGAVGNDDFGRAALAELRREGVGVAAVTLREAEHTGVALISVDADGENQITVASGANNAVDGPAAAAAVEAWAAQGGGVVLLGLEVPDGAVLAAAAAAARAEDVRVVLNPAPARQLSEELCGLGPILTPNAGEARALSGASDAEEAARLLVGRTGASVVVTVGAGGALLAEPSNDRARRVPAPSVDVVDTTGAGDTFNGAIVAALASGSDLEEAVGRAVAAAALSTRAAGARAGMPSRPDLEAFLQGPLAADGGTAR